MVLQNVACLFAQDSSTTPASSTREEHDEDHDEDRHSRSSTSISPAGGAAPLAPDGEDQTRPSGGEDDHEQQTPNSEAELENNTTPQQYRCLGPLQDWWTYIKKIDDIYQIAHVPAQAQRTIVNEFMQFGFSDSWIEGARKDCVFGLAMLILIALPTLNVEHGYARNSKNFVLVPASRFLQSVVWGFDVSWSAARMSVR